MQDAGGEPREDTGSQIKFSTLMIQLNPQATALNPLVSNCFDRIPMATPSGSLQGATEQLLADGRFHWVSDTGFSLAFHRNQIHTRRAWPADP